MPLVEKEDFRAERVVALPSPETTFPTGVEPITASEMKESVPEASEASEPEAALPSVTVLLTSFALASPKSAVFPRKARLSYTLAISDFAVKVTEKIVVRVEENPVV